MVDVHEDALDDDGGEEGELGLLVDVEVLVLEHFGGFGLVPSEAMEEEGAVAHPAAQVVVDVARDVEALDLLLLLECLLEGSQEGEPFVLLDVRFELRNHLLESAIPPQ